MNDTGDAPFRWIATAVLLSSIALSTYYRRKARAGGDVIERKREGGAMMIGRALIALPLFGSALAYLANPRWLAWSAIAVPAWVRWAGAAIGSASVPMTLWVLKTIGHNISETVFTKETHELVTTGPYRWVRHPLYTTSTAIFLSIGLMATSWFITLFAIIAIVAVRLVVIPSEEVELTAKFGDAYREYTRGTGRLLPRLRRAHSD